jgi:CIC family chloride channel protein
LGSSSGRWYRRIDSGLHEFFPAPFQGFIRKWIPLSLLVGIVVGLMAILFQEALNAVAFVFDPSRVPWYFIFLFPAAGGLLIGIIIPRFAEETAGQGMDEVIHAIHYESGKIRSIVPPVKIVVSALTINSGGSAGPEGPVGEIGAGTASILGGWLKLKRSDLRTLVIAGAAAGFGAIFKAPLGGALFALETPYKNDLEHSAVIPSLVSSACAYIVFVLFPGIGTAPIFGVLSAQPTFDLPHLGLYMFIGVLAGLVAIAFVKVFFWISDTFAGWKTPFVVKTTLGGLACGGLGIALPGVLGLGYGWDQQLVAGNLSQALVGDQVVTGLGLLLTAFAATLIAKIVATSFTIGSGGSGGVLTPSVFVGGTVGAIVAMLLQTTGFRFSPPIIVVVGMGAMLAAATKTPIASAVMMTEMTGGFNVLIPLILGTVMAYAVAGDYTLYRAQITRQSLPIDLSVLAHKTVRDVMTAPVVTLRPETSVKDAYDLTILRGHYSYPVVDEQGRILGVVYRRALQQAQARDPKIQIKSIMESHVEMVNHDAPGNEAFEVMNGSQITRMIVVDEDRRVIGMLTRVDLLRAAEDEQPAAGSS